MSASSPSPSRTSTCCSTGWSASCSSRCSACASCRCSHAFQRFPRLVREMAASVGKPARLMIEGATTEADKTIVEAIVEPLLHVLRNGLDHGVERRADARRRRQAARSRRSICGPRGRAIGWWSRSRTTAAGSMSRGSARSPGPRRRCRQAALPAMSDEEVVDLIFAPGFSTASQVTDLSGRGVGMDVVRTTVERLGGRVSVSSRPRRGTDRAARMPFTVMMTQVLTVEAAARCSACRWRRWSRPCGVARAAIVPVGAAQAVALRDRTIPVIDLGAGAWARERARARPTPTC